MTKRDLLGLLSAHEVEIRALSVRSLGVFGSVVRGEAGARSDIDLLYDFEPGQATYDNLYHLSRLLQDLLGREPDLVPRSFLSPYIGPAIIDEVEYVFDDGPAPFVDA